MSVLMRKEQPEENLTTADLAQGKRPAAAEERLNSDITKDDRPGPVLAARPAENAPQEISSESRDTSDAAPLFPNNELQELRTRWTSIQTAFVDEPRRAVEQADGLVAAAMKRLAEVFAEERSRLEQQWDRGDNVSTEDLRVAAATLPVILSTFALHITTAGGPSTVRPHQHCSSVQTASITLLHKRSPKRSCQGMATAFHSELKWIQREQPYSPSLSGRSYCCQRTLFFFVPRSDHEALSLHRSRGFRRYSRRVRRH